MSPELCLYYLPSCPYCQKVLRYMQQNGIELELRDTQDPINKQYLVANGGINQVPCLFIDGQALYESDDIIAYLGSHQA
ncbi:MAG: glutathione S-transferase N-terminal domain-containing protein [Actinomycetia bacterium]|nr:glutathione S-transferase N-terminal domain-containing protein [Actinomycetes bacterium]